MSPWQPPQNWATNIKDHFLSTLTSFVFLFLDFLDSLLCILYKHLDEFFEGEASSFHPCYCECNRVIGSSTDGEENGGGVSTHEVSETLYCRRNVFRDFGLFGFKRNVEGSWKIPPIHARGRCGGGGGSGGEMVRWSDCGCESCVSWIHEDKKKLHVVVKEPARAPNYEDYSVKSTENVIFVHGFLSSSSFWTDTVFSYLSGPMKHNYRLFAFDLLGFGRSPKPKNCLYTIRDHMEMIEKSLIDPYELKSFHLVGHSMGCIIALAMAAKYPQCVKSITLVAPPCFQTSEKEEASLNALEKLARKRLWPPLLFGSAFMSWYEHLGRCVCFLFCRHHSFWERILKLLTRRRELHLTINDLTRHTHHSAWHTMHNVICGGAKFMDQFMETLVNYNVKTFVIQGDRDLVVPIECSYNVTKMVPHAKLSVISNADHTSVIFGREKDFTQSLRQFWSVDNIES